MVLVDRWFLGEMMAFTFEVGLGRRGPDGNILVLGG